MKNMLSKSALRAATLLRRSTDSGAPPIRGFAGKPPIRGFAGKATTHDDVYEMKKWEKITYAGIATCTVLAIYNLSKGHHEFAEPQAHYPYMRIRNKDFPWGPDSLIETLKKKKHKQR